MSTLSATLLSRSAGRSQIALVARMALLILVPVWVFSGGFVLFEPAPYEALFLLVAGLALIAGIEINPRTRNLIVIVALFTPSALIAATLVRFNPIADALVYQAVTLFLLLTSFIAANYIAEAPISRMRLFNSAYIAVAVLVAAIGFLAYLGIIPGDEIFLRFGRARATFKDPNVFGAFLIYPAAVLLMRLLLGNVRQMHGAILPLLIIFIGIFVSFSRGAWALFAVTALFEFALIFLLAANAQQKVRMIFVGVCGVLALTMVTALLLSYEPIRSLFEIRAEVAQDYDVGVNGRFGRQLYVATMAFNHPWGLGPNEFGHYQVGEDPHNTYFKVFIAYGWAGGLALVFLILSTAWRGLKSLAIPSPSRLALIPVVATFVPMSIEAAIIDVDHWRHFFLLIGMVWGITAAFDKSPAAQERSLLV